MSEWGSPEWQAQNRAWLQQKLAPLDRGLSKVGETLDYYVPGNWGGRSLSSSLGGLLDFGVEASPGADVRDMRDGMQQAGRGLLDMNPAQTLNGIGLLGLGTIGMVPGAGDLAKSAIKKADDVVKGVGKKVSKYDTPEFKNWFGKSKVVDEAGQPLTVYHGTNKDFNTFDKKYFNLNEARGDYVGEGFFFADNADKAKRYASNVGGNKIMPVHLSIQNPFVPPEGFYDNMTIDELADFFDKKPSKIREKLMKQGYDGLIDKKYGQYAVFDPTQIKSIHNSGKYNPKDPNIFNSVMPLGLGAGLLSQQQEQKPQQGLLP